MGSQLAEERRPRGRPRLVGDDERRAIIVATAHDVFLEGGYSATSMDTIATRCRISKQTLYRLFSNKFDLFTSVAEVFHRSLLALPRPPDEEMPLDWTLEQIFDIDIDPADDLERVRFFEMINSEAVEHPEVAELICEKGVDRGTRLMADWLMIEERRGRLDIGDDPLDTAAILLDMTFGALATHYRAEFQAPDPDWRRRHIRRAISIFLRGAATASS
ncbi:TetR/AcrR family transcriptional regulator [Oryzibacter oryziterrae]|uniref:TetR/AcrR family transcriptional regulator n=1 Tax=Oryzibacter oryziterrae TaxID=2766474 RepID=UPI001F2C389F|nr:TetR/AcrR family transcriptional regulator [Oryzibacter oryziterrae]